MSLLLGASVWQRGFHDHALRKDEDVAGWRGMSLPIRCARAVSGVLGIIPIGMLFGWIDAVVRCDRVSGMVWL